MSDFNGCVQNEFDIGLHGESLRLRIRIVRAAIGILVKTDDLV